MTTLATWFLVIAAVVPKSMNVEVPFQKKIAHTSIYFKKSGLLRDPQTKKNKSETQKPNQNSGPLPQEQCLHIKNDIPQHLREKHPQDYWRPLTHTFACIAELRSSSKRCAPRHPLDCAKVRRVGLNGRVAQRWKDICRVLPSLKLTAILHLKIGRGPKRKRESIPTIHFLVRKC